MKGLLPGGEALAVDIGTMSDRAGFVMVPVTLEHTLAAGALALPNRDPFDRMLAAQAIVNGYAILSADTAFDRLGASRVGNIRCVAGSGEIATSLRFSQ
jgi:PIN domain nuclease of toxin-antitoxin system